MKSPAFLRFVIRHSAFITLIATLTAHADNTWDGGGGGLFIWTNNTNWGSDTAPAYGTLNFSGAVGNTNIMDANYSMNQVQWNGSSAWVLNNSGGSVLSLFDNGGTQAKLESLGTGGVTLHAPITFAATVGNNWGEINAVGSSLTFGSTSTLLVNGSQVAGIRLFGGSGSISTSFNNTVSASGKYFATSNVGQTVNIGGSFTASDFYVMNTGTLNLNTGGSLNTTAVRLGGDFATTGTQNQTLGASFNLTPTAGDLSFAGVVNAVSSNTSGALAINSQNTSGINTLSGQVALDSGLKITQAAGGTLNITQVKGGDNTTGTDLKGNNLTFTPAATGSIHHSGTIYNSTGSGTVTMNGAGTVTLSGANTYTGVTTVSAGTLKAGASNVFSGTLQVMGGGTLDLNGFNATVTQNTIVGSGGPYGLYFGPNSVGQTSTVATGSGTLFLNLGAPTSSAPGIGVDSSAVGTNIISGKLDLGGNRRPTITVSQNVTPVSLIISAVISNSDLTKLGAGTLILTGANIATGRTIVSAGTLQIGNGGTTGSLFAFTGTDGLRNNATLAFNRIDTITQGTHFGAEIRGSGAVRQIGSGTLVLNGVNIYDGLTTVSTGVLNIRNASALGTTVAGTSITSGAALQIQGSITTLAEALTLNGTGISGDGALRNISGSNSYSGLVTLGSTTRINSDSGTLTLSHAGTISGATFGLTVGGAGQTTIQSIIGTTTGTLTKDGSGTLTLTRANTYSGSTNVSGGILEVTANNALGTSAAGTSVSNGAALKLNSVNYSSTEALSLNGSGISNGGALVNSGTSTFAGQINATTSASIHAGGGTLNLTGGVVKNGTTLTIMGGGRVNVSGTGISGANANSDLLVDGTTLIVSASSNYNGPTTVQNSGSFVVNAAVTTTQLAVSADSTLSGTSSITTAGSGNYVYLNGTLQVGDSTLGAAVASSLDLKSSGASGSTVLGTASSSFLSFDLFQNGGDLTATAVASDYIRLFGNLDASLGGTLFITDAISGFHTFAAGDKWRLFDLSNNGTISGSLLLDYSSLSLTGGLIGSFDSGTGVFSISGVPEPSRALLLILGLLGVMLRRRRE